MSTIEEHEQTDAFPMNILDSSAQMTKINKRQLLPKEFPEVPPKISKSNLLPTKEIKKISSDTTDHQSLLKVKKQIQNLIDFQSRRIALLEIPTSEFSKHSNISQNFELITLDGDPIPELMLCKKCKQVRARCRMTSTPIVRHLKQHEKLAKASTIEKKKKDKKNNNKGVFYAASLTQAMKNKTPIPSVAQEYGNNLSHGQKRGIEKMILSQGDPEAQITLSKNLKRILCNKINLETCEQKKKQLYKELRDLESVTCAVKYRTIEKTPHQENRFSSQISFTETENTQSIKSKEKGMSIQIPEVNNTDSSGGIQVLEAAGTGSISIAPGENEESTNSSSVISVNDIKLEINND